MKNHHVKSNVHYITTNDMNNLIIHYFSFFGKNLKFRIMSFKKKKILLNDSSLDDDDLFNFYCYPKLLFTN